MPRLSEDFSDTEPAAVGDYTIDFGPNVPSPKTITSTAWALAVRYVAPGYTLDPSPSSRLIDPPASVNGTATVQRIANLYAGNTYLVTATAVLSDDEIVILWCTLACVAPA